MSDIREKFINKVEQRIVGKINDSDFDYVINQIILTLDEYEIQDRCTDLMLPDHNTNEDLLAMFCGKLMTEGKSKSTAKQYCWAIRNFENVIQKDYTECTTMDIRKYIARKMNDGCSKTTVEGYRSYLASFYQFLITEDIITVNPMRKIKPIKLSTQEKEPFSDVELAIIRDNVKTLRDRAMIEFLLSTGVRCSELCKMNISDVNFDTCEIKVIGGKGDKDRYTYMTKVCAKYLKDYINSRTDSNDFLFKTLRGDRRLTDEGIRNDLKSMERCGVKNIHPHRFRHTFADLCQRVGMTIQEIQMLMGHSSISTTRIYMTINKDALRSKYMQINS